MLLLVFTVVQAPEVGWASARTLLSFLAVAVLLTVFLAVERRSPGPLIRLGVLRSGVQIRAQLGAMTFFGSYVGFQFLVTLYMQSLLGWSALHTALAFLPAGALVALSATKMGAIVDRFGTPRLIAVGFALMTAGYALFLGVDLDPVYAVAVLPSMLLIGAACALVFPSLNIQATNGVDDHEQGMVSGLLNTSVQVGGAIFLAIVTAVVTAGAPEDPTPQAVLDSYRPGLIVVTGVAVAGLLIALSGLRARPAGPSAVGAGSDESAGSGAFTESTRPAEATGSNEPTDSTDSTDSTEKEAAVARVSVRD
jgi:sugar phosphate permease